MDAYICVGRLRNGAGECTEQVDLKVFTFLFFFQNGTRFSGYRSLRVDLRVQTQAIVPSRAVACTSLKVS